MGKYKVTSGQNIYDVALHIYGAIEGIVDLMINNPEMSFCDNLQSGDELIYTDELIINADVVAHNRLHKIVPANGERNVYYKQPSLPRIASINLRDTQTIAGFSISGKGEIHIDWGDNSPIEVLVLSDKTQAIQHFFDNQIQSRRLVFFYGDCKNILIQHADFTNLIPKEFFVLQPIQIESCTLKDVNINIGFIPLLDNIYNIDFTGLVTSNLLPLLECKKLMTLNLTCKLIPIRVIDEFLIALVENHNGRRNCIITLPCDPSGEYKEPIKDENNEYILTTGLEAVWVLTNEPAWNEGGYWKIITNENTYTTEP